MSNTEKLSQIAKGQNFDDRATAIFNSVCQDVGISDLSQTTPEQSDRLLVMLKQNDASPEFVKNMLIYGLQKGMPAYVIDHIMNSDHDKDGRTLSQELFEDNTNPYESQSQPQQTRSSRKSELEL